MRLSVRSFRFDSLELRSGRTLSTSSMFVSLWICFMAPAPDLSAVNVSAVVLLPSRVMTCSSSLSCWFWSCSICCS